MRKCGICRSDKDVEYVEVMEDWYCKLCIEGAPPSAEPKQEVASDSP